LDRRLVNPRVGLDDVEKRKFLTPPALELRPLGRPQPVDSRYTDCAIPAHILYKGDQIKDDELRSMHGDDECIKTYLENVQD
jgi:hypothetical protein